ncbi:MAG: hypothetical protein Q7S37_01770 [bacterium]|nr:hypothetical protein [bacterium]
MDKSNSTATRTLISIAIYILTIIVLQQIINAFFPDDSLTRKFAELILDTMLIIVSLVVKNTVVGYTLLAAGFTRYLFIFFQSWDGGSATAKPAIFGFVVLVLIIVAVIKFGHLSEQHPKEV